MKLISSPCSKHLFTSSNFPFIAYSYSPHSHPTFNTVLQQTSNKHQIKPQQKHSAQQTTTPITTTIQLHNYTTTTTQNTKQQYNNTTTTTQRYNYTHNCYNNTPNYTTQQLYKTKDRHYYMQLYHIHLDGL